MSEKTSYQELTGTAGRGMRLTGLIRTFMEKSRLSRSGCRHSRKQPCPSRSRYRFSLRHTYPSRSICRMTLGIPLLITLITPSTRVMGQQEPLVSQYTLNKFLVNPALAGATGYTNLNLTARQMYTGFQNAPRSLFFSGETRLLEDIHILKRQRVEKNSTKASRTKNIGIGGMLFNDRNGIIGRTGMQLSYGYHINFDGKYQISFGLSLTAYQFRIDDENALVLDPGDPLLTSSKKNFFVPDANTGIYFSGHGFYTGLSITELFGSSLKLGPNKFENYKALRHFYLLTGYKFAASEQIYLEPSLLARGTVDRLQFDLSAKIFYQRNYWAGITWRSNNTLAFMAGFSYQEFYLGYAYDANMGAIQTYGGGSHEIMLGLHIGENSTRRFRWLRPDISEAGE